jgi:hypothetical protein
MTTLFSGLLVATMSFFINKYLVAKLGNWAIIYLIPLCEELLKTGAYYFIGGNLVIIHLIFGIVEAKFDILNSKGAAALAIVTHSVFGGLTFYCLILTKNLVLAILITILIHLFWNYLMGRGNNAIDL